MSQQKVAKKLGYCVDTIARQLKEYKIESHKNKDWNTNKEIKLSDDQINVLYGSLLGDGCLFKHKNGMNSQFIYSSKSKQHVEFVYKMFGEQYSKNGVSYQEYYDNRTNKTYCHYSFKTQCNIAFEKERDKWYYNNKKIIPKDLIINPTICLIWYVGDGALCNSKRSQYIQLSTDCFSYDEVNYLCSQLSEFEAKPMRQKDVYRIYIPHHKIKKFLQYIGDCPFSDYKYKWEFKDYKNFSALNNPEFIDCIVDMFDSGYSAGTIAKHLKIDRNTVVKYLIKNGFDPKVNLYKKKKVGDDDE